MKAQLDSAREEADRALLCALSEHCEAISTLMRAAASSTSSLFAHDDVQVSARCCRCRCCRTTPAREGLPRLRSFR